MITPDELDFSDFDEFEPESMMTPDADLAYVKKEVVNHEAVWTIYNGNGEKMGHAANREVAMIMVSQSALRPHSVH